MSVYYIAGYPVSDELYHWGIIGQKKGVRRFQNEDGSLTQAGRLRYGVGILENGASGDEVKNMQKALSDAGYGSLLKKYGADGKFGSETQTALNRFKKDNGLPQDGKFDDKTKALLDKKTQKQTAQASSSATQIDPKIKEAAEALANLDTTSDSTNGSDSSSSKKKSSGGNKKGSSGKKKRSLGGSSSSGDSDEGSPLLENIGSFSVSKIGELLPGSSLDSASTLVSTLLGGDSSLLTDATSISTLFKSDPMALRTVIRTSAINGREFVSKMLLNQKYYGGKSK